VLLLALGAAGGAWATRLPSIQDKLHLDPGMLGLALVGQPLGLIVAVQLVPRLVRKWSSAQVARWSMVAAAIVIVMPALAWSAATLFVALLLVGVMFGTSDISVNVQAVAVEHGMRTKLIPATTRPHFS
jgi:MFS family permease